MLGGEAKKVKAGPSQPQSILKQKQVALPKIVVDNSDEPGIEEVCEIP